MRYSNTVNKMAIGTILLFACLFLFQNSAFAVDEEALCLRFVEEKLQSEGGIFTNYLPSKDVNELAAGHSILSESQGLMLSYYVRAGNKAMATKTAAFVQKRMDTGNILCYRLDEDGHLYPVNASVDDLRLIGATLEAAEAFHQPDYLDQAMIYANRLYDTNVQNDMLADFYDVQFMQADVYATLCYSDLHSMQAIAAYDERWLTVMENMRKIVMGGYLNDTFPFFHTRYNFEKHHYESDNIPMVESLLTAYHLSSIASCPKQTLEYLKNTLQKGKLYSLYSFDGKPLSNTESTAIYALCAMIGASEKDVDLYRISIEHMLSFQVTDPLSPVYGAFADAKTLQAYSFDNLMALLAIQAGTALSGDPSFPH